MDPDSIVIIGELLQRIKDLTAERDELEALAKRSYPELKPSGACSKHHSNKSEGYECSACYPNWPQLCTEHVKVVHSLQSELAALKGDGEKVEWIDDDEGDCYTKALNANCWYQKTTSQNWRWEIWDGGIDEIILASGYEPTKDLVKQAAEKALAELRKV